MRRSGFRRVQLGFAEQRSSLPCHIFPLEGEGQGELAGRHEDVQDVAPGGQLPGHHSQVTHDSTDATSNHDNAVNYENDAKRMQSMHERGVHCSDQRGPESDYA